jgi:peptidoglycan/xylan/chitin deacetylase (PgdA/CDA1 family)
MKPSGIFTISLDFELYWGVRDLLSLREYGRNILGVHQAIPRLLGLFRQYEIHGTWAVVGFLHFRNAGELREHIPRVLPTYREPRFNPYDSLPLLDDPSTNLAHYFAPDLIDAIVGTPHQELGTHTFSHYYCLEPGQSAEQFRADLEAAAAAAEQKTGRRPSSLVFPRNQFNAEYLQLCLEAGVRAVRGNQRSWSYDPRNLGRDGPMRRAVRLLDAYVNLTGCHGYPLGGLRPSNGHPAEIPASQFLRPWSRSLRWLEPLKERRIKRSLTRCAKRGMLYHLWWHPHNFGAELEENMQQLRRILDHFARLRERHGMRSLNMSEVSEIIHGQWEQ